MENTANIQTASRSSRWAACSQFLDRLMGFLLHATLFLVPLWFLPITLDVFELNKQTILCIFALILAVAWTGKALIQKSVMLSRSWVHVAVGVFMVAFFAASLASQDRYVSFIGNFGQMQWAFATVAALGILYFAATNLVKETRQVYNLVLTFLGSSALVALIALCQFFQWYPFKFFFPPSANIGFNTIGSVNALAIFLAVPIVLATSLLVLGCKDDTCVLGKKGKPSQLAAVLVWVSLLLSLFAVVFVDFWGAWSAILFGTVCVLLISFARQRSVGKPLRLVVPGIVCLLSIALLVWPLPSKLQLNLPGEVSPSLAHSWQISKQVLGASPLLGSGPGTWIYDYSQYRSPSANVSQFWSYRFDHGISSLLTLLGTVGILGVLAWLLLILSAVIQSASHLVREKNDDRWQAYLTIFSAWATVAFTGFIYNFSLAQQVTFWFLLALLVSLLAAGSYEWKADTSLKYGLLWLKFVLVTVASCVLVWLAVQRLMADSRYTAAVAAYQSGAPVQTAIDDLNQAVALNPWNDTYYRNLSQAYLIRAGQVLNSDDKNKGNLASDLVRASIGTAQQATTSTPANVDDWSNEAVIYQSIESFTRGADDAAIKSYQTALLHEPNNPVFYDQIGRIYILKADAYSKLLSSKDPKVVTEAQGNIRAMLDKAAEQLNQSIQAKPDYAPAHYDLAILYDREGKTANAITKMEQVLSANNKDVGVGFQLSILYYRNNQKDKAQYLLEQIVALDPTYANARWYLATLYEENGRYDDAIAQVQKLLQQYPGNQNVTQRIQQLTQERDQKAKPKAQPLPQPIPENITSPTPANSVQ